MKERTLIGEAFKALEALNESEDTFDVSEEGIEEIKDFLNDDSEDDTVTIFDDEAEDEEELEDSYVGKVIIDCCVCHSLIYKAPDEVIIDEETDLANVDEECPYCHSTGDGYKVVGEVAPYNPVDNDNVSVEIEKKEDADFDDDDEDDDDTEEKKEKKDDEKKESLRRKNFRSKLYESKNSKKSFSKLIESKTRESAINYIPRKKRNESLNESNGSSSYNCCGINIDLEELKNRTEECYKCLCDNDDTISDGAYGDFTTPELCSGFDDYMNMNSEFVKLAQKFTAYAGPVLSSDRESAAFYYAIDELYGPEIWDAIDSYNVNESFANRKNKRNMNEGKIPHYESSVGKKLADNIAEINKQKSVDGVIKVVKSTLAGNKEPGKGTYADNFIKKLSAKKSLNDAIQLIFSTILASEGMSVGKKKKYEAMMNRVIRRNLREAFDDVQISTDTEKITIKSEPRDDSFEGEMVAPVEPEIKDEILDNSAPEEEEVDELNIEEETPNGPEEEEVTDFDEENFDELGESFLKKHYDNVKSFKTTKIYESKEKKNNLVVEGVVTFNSGKKKTTSFNFRGDRVLPSGMHRLVGENLDICNAKKAFHINGRIKDKKFIAESLNYNYTVGGKRVSGSVRRKKK